MQKQYWSALIVLVSELKKCDEKNLTSASLALAYICIDTLANLSREKDKPQGTRSDFKKWVDTYLKAHEQQLYQYRGKDVYAARCAFLHSYSSEAELYKTDNDIKKFGYSDSGQHAYNPEIDERFVIIGTKSFINDVIIGIEAFLNDCKNNKELKVLVESRLPSVLQNIQISK